MKRNKFALSHYRLFSCDMAELVPISCIEVLPGDTIQQATSLLVRVSPLISPVMHPVHVRVHHWFVPNRLVWDDWEDFITGGEDGMNTSAFPQIRFPAPGAAVGSLPDYFGIPPGTDLQVNALPFRAYNLIYNEWYRDQDLQGERSISTEEGLDAMTDTSMAFCNWEKDYFTTARPWTQKGPEITLPLGIVSGQAPVRFPTWPGEFVNVDTHGDNASLAGLAGDNKAYWNKNITESGNRVLPMPGDAYAELNASVGAVGINDLREAFALQRYEENRARYGSRFTEYLAFLGIRSSDARLQRPEYLGGGKQVIQFSEVLQTTPEPGAGIGAGVGDLAGHGIGAMRSNRYRKFFEEHGHVISLLSVKPKTMYSQGVRRFWNKTIKEDFFQRELQHIGQQEILNKELYADGTAADNEVFGYQDRYDEYRRMESIIAGDFRDTLDYWHYARMFANRPALNSDFVKSTPTKRVNAVQTEDVLWCMARHSIQARRLVAKNASSFIF